MSWTTKTYDRLRFARCAPPRSTRSGCRAGLGVVMTRPVSIAVGAYRDLEYEASDPPRCDCGELATCFGSYEGQPPFHCCDECCGHGCEDGRCEQVSSKPRTRNHLAIAQLSSQLNISLGLKRAVDAAAIGAAVRSCTARLACACNVCGRVQLWTELANHREWRFGGEGGAEDFEIAECACTNTLSRVIATRTVAA